MINSIKVTTKETNTHLLRQFITNFIHHEDNSKKQNEQQFIYETESSKSLSVNGFYYYFCDTEQIQIKVFSGGAATTTIHDALMH